tara:strand:+ start:5760 stop:6152 length:393 start_codon:yes stop_codon:yes gene_type:complete
MSDKFNVQIISPDKTILKSEVFQVIIPAYEGLMTILKDHISIVTFLRPGFIEAEINNEVEKIYVEEGTVEFSNNNLLILSSTAKNKKDFSSQEAQQALEVSKSLMKNDEINDKEKYFLSYKIEALQQVIN